MAYKKEEKKPVGRPLKYKTDKELKEAIDKYFKACDNRKKEVVAREGVVKIVDPEPYTMSGLAYALGMNRNEILCYGEKEQFSCTVKEARNKVQRDVERRLMEGGSSTGAIFNLKNNFGWVDKTEVESTVTSYTVKSNLDLDAE